MSSSVEEHVVHKVANALVHEYPYPHIYVENIFPADFYAALRTNWPGESALVCLGDTGRVTRGAYRERFVMPLKKEAIDQLDAERRPFWNEVAAWLITQRFMNSIISKFEPYVKQRFGDDLYECGFGADALLVRDLSKFNMGPHTDAPHRLLSMLFYCPPDESLKNLGTSIYVPRDPAFSCKGGPHHQHALFHKIQTMEYKPNTLFAFVKNDRSFHGVEPINEPDVLRDMLLYDIRVFPPGKRERQERDEPVD
jgi:hypothetical protein